MREIKFRVWDKKENRFLDEDEFVIDNNGRVYRWLNDNTLELIEHSMELLQSTGLKDKNGVEIYDGYILSHGDTYFQVVFRDGAYLLFYKLEPSHRTLISLCEGLEVVGNIYEHSHLLESEK